jgi:hypothetical protein
LNASGSFLLKPLHLLLPKQHRPFLREEILLLLLQGGLDLAFWLHLERLGLRLDLRLDLELSHLFLE